MEVGKRITELRAAKGIYQKQLADDLQVSVATISNYENGRHIPDPVTLCKIADFFGVTTDYLLGRTNLRYEAQNLKRPITRNYTIADLVNTTLELSPKNRVALAEYVRLLKLKEDNAADTPENIV